jgi:thiamine kinase-like enzyme
MIKALSDNPDHFLELCARLDIGTPQHELSRVYGGFHHKMWRLETDRGSYAVKQLSADTDLSQADVIEHYNVAEVIAEMFSGYGLSAVFALKRGAYYLQLLESVGYLVYPWTNAVAVGKNEITEIHAHEIARVLAKIHGANIHVPRLTEQPLDIRPEDKILLLVQRAVECNVHGAVVLKEQLPTLLNMVDAQRTAVQLLQRHRVISHGDLDHKNVLWSDSGNPVIIDWESARRMNPTHEILLEALDWSGITSTFQHGLFEKFISSYKEAGGVIEGDLIQASFDCILGDWLNWLMYNVGRSVDFEDTEQHTIGAEQVDLSWSTILRLRHLMPQLLAMARSG